MYCPSCGEENPDSNKLCVNCGETLPNVATAQEVGGEANNSARSQAGGLPPRRRRAIWVTLGLGGLTLGACVVVAAVALWNVLDLGGTPRFPGSEDLVVAFPNRSGEADLFLLELGQSQEEGVLLAEDARAADRVSLQYWDADGYYSISGVYGGFVPGSNRLLVFYREEGDDDVIVQQIAIGDKHPQEIYSTNALPLLILTFARHDNILFSESRDDQRRCYVASPGETARRLAKGEFCSAASDGSLAYLWEVDPDKGEASFSTMDMSGENETVVLDNAERVEWSNIRPSDDGSHIVYLQESDDGQQLFLVERRSGVVSEASATVFAIDQFGFLPNTDLVYYTAENDDGYLELYIGNVESPIATAYAMAISPTRDGQHFIYARGDEDGENTCYSYDVRNGESRSILTADNLQCIAISELNRIILWEVDEDEVTLYSAPIEGGDPVELFAEDGIIEANIRYLSNGSRVFIEIRDDDGDWSLFTTGLDGEEGFYLLERWHEIRLLDSTSDEKQLVLWGQEDRGDRPVLISVRVEKGARLVELEKRVEAFRNAFFTPNGRDIVYSAVTGDAPDDVQVIRVRADGEGPGEVLYEEAAIDSIRWGETNPFHGVPFFSWNTLLTGSSFCPGAPVLAKITTLEDSLEEGSPACFRLTAQRGDILTFEIDTMGLSNSLDTTLTLRNRDGEQLAYNDDSTLGRDARLTVTIDEGGIYFVEVGGNSTPDSRFSLSLFERTDGFSAARRLSGDATISSAVTGESILYLAAYEYDGYGQVYSFEGHAGDRIKIEVLAGSIGSELNPSVYLIDGGLQVIASDESDSDSLIVHSLNQSGTYYILVIDGSNRYGSSSDFKYELHLQKAKGLQSLVIPIGERSVYSSAYYATVDRVEFDADNFYIYFESFGRSDLRRPETSCVVEKPTGRTVRLIDYDTPVRQSTNYKGVLVFPLEQVRADAEYYFRYSCSGYSDVFLFDGSVVWP